MDLHTCTLYAPAMLTSSHRFGTSAGIHFTVINMISTFNYNFTKSLQHLVLLLVLVYRLRMNTQLRGLCMPLTPWYLFRIISQNRDYPLYHIDCIYHNQLFESHIKIYIVETKILSKLCTHLNNTSDFLFSIGNTQLRDENCIYHWLCTISRHSASLSLLMIDGIWWNNAIEQFFAFVFLLLY